MTSLLLDRPPSLPALNHTQAKSEAAVPCGLHRENFTMAAPLQGEITGPVYSNNALIKAIQAAGMPLANLTRDLTRILDSGERIERQMPEFVRGEYARTLNQLTQYAEYISQKWSGEQMPPRVRRTRDWIEELTRSFVSAVQRLEDTVTKDPWKGNDNSPAVQELVDFCSS